MHNLRLPAEWEPQSGVMLTWPYPGNTNFWRNAFDQVETIFYHLAAEIAQREQVLIVCHDEQHRDHIESALSARAVNLRQICFAVAASNDVWARDHGPIFAQQDNHLIPLNFVFTGWGNKFPSSLDNQINTQLSEQGLFGKHNLRDTHFVLEGGGIESDGQGNLLTTRHCLLNENRNKGMSQLDIEQKLSTTLGITRFLWLEHGHLAGDDTDGHIDTLARFCNVDTIAYVKCDDQNDEHYKPLLAMETELKNFRTFDGEPYRLVGLPLPGIQTGRNGERLPATYANFLIINDAVLVPTYRDPLDSTALGLLAECFPGRQVIGIDCVPLIQQYGSLHCVTMQLPAGALQCQKH